MAKHHFSIDIPLYHAHVHICLTKKAYLKLASDAEDECPDEELCDGWATKSTKGNIHVVALIRLEHSVIAHELLHVTFSLLKHAGVEYSEQSEEAFTYLLGHLTSEVYKGLEKLNKHDKTPIPSSAADAPVSTSSPVSG